MKPLIYISGPITDNKTGEPRDGWQEDFRKAEKMLRGMGFDVITPVEVAVDAEKQWQMERQHHPLLPAQPQRWFYIATCIDVLGGLCYKSACGEAIPDDRKFVGLYVIGDMSDISMSYGTMCEINLAMAAGLPVWSQYYEGHQMTNMFFRAPGITLEECAVGASEE